MRGAVWEVDADQPVASVRSMREVLDAELTSRNTQMTLVGGFAALALLLAAVGLYGVLSYTVAQRTAEIGLRMALGAQTATVVRGVVRSALGLAAIGIALGLAGAFGVTRFLSSFLFGVSPMDPATFAAVAVLLVVVTIGRELGAGAARRERGSRVGAAQRVATPRHASTVRSACRGSSARVRRTVRHREIAAALLLAQLDDEIGRVLVDLDRLAAAVAAGLAHRRVDGA